MDKVGSFLFLPLEVPSDMDSNQCKVMSNGETLLVMVTEKPQEEPETNALRKYKLLVNAIKREAVHDEDLLRLKLQTWLDTEEDDEVKVYIRRALDSLAQVNKAKNNTSPRVVSVPMGVLSQKHVRITQHTALPPTEVAQAKLALPFLRRSRRRSGRAQSGVHMGIIKESFAVEIPYPVPSNQIFVVKVEPTYFLVGMPLKRESLEAKGISTGGKPFIRAPLFDPQGQRLAGPAIDAEDVVGHLRLSTLSAKDALIPLVAVLRS